MSIHILTINVLGAVYTKVVFFFLGFFLKTHIFKLHK